MSQIGQRIQELRTERVPRLTQRELAERAGLSVDLIQKLEQGRKATAKLKSLTAIADALDVDLPALLSTPTHLESLPVSGGLLALRRALTPVIEPDCEPMSSDELRSSLGEAWSVYWSGDYDLLAGFLPGVIDGARAAGADDSLAEACQIAASTLVHIGHSDLSLVATDIALRTARDPLLLAAVTATKSWVLLGQARPNDAAAMAVRAADQMEPTRKAGRAEISLWGNLLVTGATAAARAGDADEAQDLLQVAHGAAVRLGENRRDYQAPFGADQVVMQRVDVAVVAGDYVSALEVAKGMPAVSSLPLAARSRHKVDLAHAHASLGNYSHAEQLLLEIERAAPRWMRYQVFPRAVVGQLLAAPRPSPAVRRLATRLGVH